MIPSRRIVDHRKHKRYHVPKDSYICVGPDDCVMGQIIDISMGGIAFRHMGSERLPDEAYMDIFLTEGNLYLRRVPFKRVADYEIRNIVLEKTVDPIPLSYRTMKRGCVEFGELTPDQISQLEHCIQNCAIGEV
jgi:hypothetical protein